MTLQFLQRQQPTTTATATTTTTAALESTEDTVNDRTNKKQQKQESVPLSILAAQLRDSLEDSTPKSFCRGCGIGNTTDPTTVRAYTNTLHNTSRYVSIEAVVRRDLPGLNNVVGNESSNKQTITAHTQQRTNVSSRVAGADVSWHGIRGQQPFDGNHHNVPVVRTPPRGPSNNNNNEKRRVLSSPCQPNHEHPLLPGTTRNRNKHSRKDESDAATSRRPCRHFSRPWKIDDGMPPYIYNSCGGWIHPYPAY